MTMANDEYSPPPAPVPLLLGAFSSAKDALPTYTRRKIERVKHTFETSIPSIPPAFLCMCPPVLSIRAEPGGVFGTAGGGKGSHGVPQDTRRPRRQVGADGPGEWTKKRKEKENRTQTKPLRSRYLSPGWRFVCGSTVCSAYRASTAISRGGLGF